MSVETHQLGPKANAVKKSISISFHPQVPSCKRRWCERSDAPTHPTGHASDVESDCVKPRFALMV